MPSDEGMNSARDGNGTSVPQVGEPKDRSSISFDVSLKSLLIRLIKNKIFGLLTFGFYRFWGKTHIRRQLWQGVRIGDDALEYRGTAKELFIGFLIAMVILVPILLLSSVAIEILSIASGNPLVHGVGQIAYFALLFGFWQFARYRLWRYRLSRTAWRGIRFYLTGSAIRYALNMILRSFVVLVTLGWAYPWRQAYRLNYQLNNTHFGNGKFTYDGSTKDLYRLYWPAILIAQVVTVAAIAYVATSSAIDFSAETLQAVEAGKLKMADGAAMKLVLIGAVLFLTFMVFSFVTRIWEFRYLVEKTSFKEARFSSSLRVRSVLLIFVLMILLAVVSIAIIAGFFVAIVYWQKAAAVALPFIFFILLLIGMDILYTLFLLVPILKKICETAKIENLEVFEETAAASVNSPAYGEGFADAMDVGAF